MVTKTALALALAVGLTACAVPVQAQSGRYGYPTRNTRIDAYAFDQGYQDGYNEGRDDGHDRHGYQPRDSRDYRNADRGALLEDFARHKMRVGRN